MENGDKLQIILSNFSIFTTEDGLRMIAFSNSGTAALSRPNGCSRKCQSVGASDSSRHKGKCHGIMIATSTAIIRAGLLEATEAPYIYSNCLLDSILQRTEF